MVDGRRDGRGRPLLRKGHGRGWLWPVLSSAALACLVAMACGRDQTEVGAEWIYIEAESGELAGGFVVRSDPLASGGEYIESAPPADGAVSQDSLQAPGPASATYTFQLVRGGPYYLWGRMHGPDPMHNILWATVDGDMGLCVPFGASQAALVPLPLKWRLSTGVNWWWRKITVDFDYQHPIECELSAGPHSIVFHNAEPGVGLDRILVVPADLPAGLAPDPVPPNPMLCDPRYGGPPDYVRKEDGGCERSCGSYGTTATCMGCAGLPTRPSYDCTVCCVPGAGVDAGISDGGADEGVFDTSSDETSVDAAADSGVSDSLAQ